jgi:hypothetical protein
LIDNGWDRVFDDAVAADHSAFRIICPFIKQRAAKRLLNAGKPETIQVITRFNLSDFCNGVSDTAALRLLLEHRAKIRGVRNLHAKIYLFGARRVIVTSANLTDMALRRNHEFGFVAEAPDIFTRCREYFDDLWKRAGSDLTEARLCAWEKQLSDLLAGGSRSSKTAGLPDEGADAGVTAPPIVLPSLVAEAPQSFVKFFGVSSDRAHRNLPVLEEVNRSGCHWACTYPKGKRPRKVEDGAVMFMGRLVKDPKDIMIYGRAVAIRHQEGRDDATPADVQQRSWKKQWPHYIRVHHAEFVAGTLKNGVALSQLMDVLKSNAFASTQQNVAAGNGNTDPRRAYMQQPAVRLSDEAFNWLNYNLETAFQKYGKLCPTELEQLDWPKLPVTVTDSVAQI